MTRPKPGAHLLSAGIQAFVLRTHLHCQTENAHGKRSTSWPGAGSSIAGKGPAGDLPRRYPTIDVLDGQDEQIAASSNRGSTLLG